jgi:hypothetical protein
VFVQAQEQGRAELAALRQRIPTMRVTTKPEAQTLQGLQINVNDKQMPNELLGIARPVNPGPYRITAAASGWSTAAPVTVEVQEKEQMSVEVPLTQGAPSAPVVVAAPGAKDAPPPYDEAAKPKPAARPSTTGLLLGLRAGFFVPGGDVDKTTKFENYATAGPGFGVDVIGRVAKIVLLGGTFEFASLGAPSARAFPAGTRADVGTQSTYFGLLAGIMPNVDKITFVADAGLGLRTIDRTLTLTDATNVPRKSNESYSGAELALNAGISFPAGPMRIVPKAGLSFGQFSDRNCGTGAAGNLVGCGISDPTVATSGHTMFSIVVGIYYHLDMARKPATAQSSRALTTASSGQ